MINIPIQHSLIGIIHDETFAWQKNQNIASQHLELLNKLANQKIYLNRRLLNAESEEERCETIEIMTQEYFGKLMQI